MKGLLISDKLIADSPFNTESLQLAFEYFSGELDCKSSEEEIDFSHYDIILIDQNAYGFGGPDFIKFLKKQFPLKPLFLLKEQSLDTEHRIELSDMEIQTITKPLTPSTVIRRIKGVLQNE